MVAAMAFSFLSVSFGQRVSTTTRIFNISVIFLYAVLLPLLLSRSVLVGAMLAILLYGAIRTWQVGVNYGVKNLLISIPIMAVVILVGGESLWSVINSMLLERDASVDSRLDQYEFAFGVINDSIWGGQGVGFTVGHNVIHNLFLAAWVQSGFVGFILALIMYLGLVISWVKLGLSALPNTKLLPLGIYVPWLLTLPVIPLFRVWIGGDGGNIDPSGWVALGIYFGMGFALKSASQQPKTVNYI
jgi:O-antigen ligase